MTPDPKILDDIARVAGGALNVAGGMKQQFKEDLRSRMEDMAVKMDLVPREDLDQAMAMINKLQNRVEALEEKLIDQKGKGKKTKK